MTEISNITRGKTVLLIVLSLVLILSALFSVVITMHDKKYSFWPGYHLLLVEKKDNQALSEQLEKEMRFKEIISKYNTDVEFSNYSTLKKVMLYRVYERFNSLDPRFDKYMKNAGAYFETESGSMEYEIIYIKTDLSEQETSEILENIIDKKIKWELASVSYRNFRYLILSVYLIISAALMYVKKLKSPFFFFLLSVWFLVILKSEISLFYVSVLNIVFISYFIEIIELAIRNWFNEEKFSIDFIVNRKNILIGTAVFLMSNAVIFIVNPSVKSFLVFGFMFFAECAVLSLDLVYGLKKAVSHMHRIFCSIPILEVNKTYIFDKWIKIKPVYFYLVVLLISLPAVFLSAGKSSFILPQPVPVISNSSISEDISFDSLKELSEYQFENNNLHFLPDVSDYFSHLAYQIRLPYNSEYSIPEKDESITISHYSLKENNYQKEKKTVYLFTDLWLKDNIIIVKEKGLTGLMLSYGKPVKIALTDTNTVINPLFFGCLYCVFYLALILMVVRKDKPGKTNLEKHILPVIKRRKQQAA